MKRFFNKWNLLILLSIVILAFILVWPSIPRLTTQYIGDGGDNYEYASYMMLFTKNISQGNLPFGFTNYWRYPVGIDFARSFDSHLAVTTGGILNSFIRPPLSYNLTVIILMVLNGLFSFVFFKYLTKSNALGFLGMLIYGFSFYTLAKAEAHLNLLFIGGFPLLAYSILRIVKEPQIDRTKLFLFFSSLLLIALGSKEYFFIALFFLVVYFIITALFYKSIPQQLIIKLKASYKLVLISTVLFLIAFGFVFAPYILAVFNGQFYFPPRADTLFASTPAVADYFIPNGYLNLLSNIVRSNSRISIESMVFVGWIELLIFILFFFNRNIEKRFKVFIFVAFLIPFTLSLGYGKQDMFPFLPYHFLKDFFIFKITAETNRYFVMFYLIIASAVVLTLNPLRQNKRLFGVVLALIIALLLLERLPLKIMTVPTLEGNYTTVVKNLPGSAVLDLPVNIYFANYDILSFYYNKAIVNGYFHWASDGPKEREFINSNWLNDYICNGYDDARANHDQQILEALKANNISTIVVHKDYNFYFPDCKNVRIRLSRLFQDTVVVDQTAQQKQLLAKAYTGYPKMILYFPKSGKFDFDGLYVAPSSQANFSILVNNTSIDNVYSWHAVGSPNGKEILPKDTLEINVNGGSTVTIYSNSLVDTTYFSVWYRYLADQGAVAIPYRPFFEKVYQDDKADVYQLQ